MRDDVTIFLYFIAKNNPFHTCNTNSKDNKVSLYRNKYFIHFMLIMFEFEYNTLI